MRIAPNQPEEAPSRTAASDAAVRVAFVGAGKVGCSLAMHLAHTPECAAQVPADTSVRQSTLPSGAPSPAAVRIVGFASATPEHAREAAAFAGGEAFRTAAEAAAAADVVFLTTPDGQIAAAWDELAQATRSGRLDLSGKVVCHCSGALPSSVLAGADELGAHACSVHPLYAVSSRFESWRELAHCWFTLEGDQEATDLVAGLLRARGSQVATIDAAEKTRYHAAAVMASNLVVGLYEEASQQLVRCGFPMGDAQQALAALFLGNAEHLARDGVDAALTGPAARGDAGTIAAHLRTLDGDDREIYRLLTEVLYRIAARRSRAAERSETGS